MAVERVRLSLDLIARIDEAGMGRGIDHPLAVGVVTLDRAELGDEILLAADAFARHPRIEEIGAEAHVDRISASAIAFSESVCRCSTTGIPRRTPRSAGVRRHHEKTSREGEEHYGLRRLTATLG